MNHLAITRRLAGFWHHVTEDGACWRWAGSIDKDGYGRWGDKMAHRVAYELTIGPIPEGMTLDHVRERGCSLRCCVNPAHLEPVTIQENIKRGSGVAVIHAAKVKCVNGHPFDQANTRIDPRTSSRICRTCQRDARRRYVERTHYR